MEEARYELEEALERHRHQGGKNRNGSMSRSRAGSWKEMKLDSLDLDEKRTGFLSVGLSKTSGRFSPEEALQQRAGSCFEMEVVHESKAQTKNNTQTSRVSMLCSVAPGRPGPFSKLVLVVYERDSIDRLLSLLRGPNQEARENPSSLGAKIRWKIRFCASLLSHCRQFEACDFGCASHRKKGGALLKEIMGQKQATHIRFCDSDDGEDEKDDNVGKGEEETVGYVTEETDGDYEGEKEYDEDEDNDDNDHGQSNIYNADACVKQPQCSKLHLTMSSFPGLKALNSTQKMAAEKFCSSNESKSRLELIQGPPGTGKTTFVVSVLARLLCQSRGKGRRKRPRRILVTAPTNKAVGVIAKRFMESCPGLLDHHGIPVAMIGVQDKLLEPDEEGKVDDGLKRIFCYTWLDTIAEEYERLLEELSLELIETKHSSLTCPPEVGNRGLSQWLSKAIPPSKNKTLMVGDESDSDTEEEDKSGDNNALRATHEESRSTSVVQKARGLHLRLVRNLPWWSEASGAANLSRKLLSFVKDGDIPAACAYIKALLKILKEDIDDDDDDDDDNNNNNCQDQRGIRAVDAVPELLASARVIFCTLSTAGTSLMKNTLRIDDWIVDEAAAATEPELLIPLHLDPMRLLVVGDPRQLPASVSSPLSERWGLGRSLHERLTVDLGRTQIMLDVQYRMKPEIAEFPSQQFYGGKLLNGENVQEATYGSFFSSTHGGNRSDGWGVLETTPPFCFFQVNGKEQQSHTGSYYNKEEAFALVAMLKAIRGRFHPQGKESSHLWCSADKIRVITFYSAQVAVLRQILQREGLQGVLVATVDSSQGCEADLVVLSFVRTIRAGFLKDNRRMNVGLTRARHKLVCLANVDSVTSGSVNSTTLTNLLREAKERGCVSLALTNEKK